MYKNYLKQLFVAMVALLCSVAATALDFEVGGIYYNVTDETNLTVEVTFKGYNSSSYSDEYTGSIVIPSTVSYNGKKYGVTSIGDYSFNGCSSLTSITIPNSVASIGSRAFYGCSGLTSVTIPNSVTSIGRVAFSGCSALTSVDIPNSVTSIGSDAFSGCSALTSVTIPNGVTSIEDYSFSGCSALASVTIGNGVKSIGFKAFGDCGNLSEVHISDLSAWCKIDFASHLFSHPFFYCNKGALFLNGKEITDLIIPNDITEIKESTFYNCVSFTSINIHNRVTCIESEAFYGCSSLKSLFIPNSVTSIGYHAFSNCSGLTSVVVEEGNKKYDSRDNCNAIIETITNTLVRGCENTIIPNSVTSIGVGAFYGCSGLKSVTIPNSVTSIGSFAFEGCSGLTSVTIGNSVTSIGRVAFSGCSALTSVTIPNGVTSIEERTFYYCTGLTSVDIPNSVTSIGERAFHCCRGLTSINIPNGVTHIGEQAFQGCSSLKSIAVLNSLATIGEWAFSNCTSLTSVTMNCKEISWDLFAGVESVRCVTIGKGVKSIGDYLFKGCTIKKLILEDGAETLLFGNDAFYSVQLDSLYLGRNLSNFWFNGQKSLKSVTIGDSVTRIAGGAFGNCSGLTSITIGNSVTSIGYEAFAYCTGLTSIIIPNSVTSIDHYAFSGCKNLSEIICYAMEPPLSSNSVFKNIPNISNVVLKVHPGSILYYSSADGWKNFNILPLNDIYVQLTVSLPDETVGDYENMLLELVNVETEQSTKCTVTSRARYKFNVEKNEKYRLLLKNAAGVVFKEVNDINVGNEDLEINLDKLPQLHTATLRVLLPDGTNITDETGVVWMDTTDSYLSGSATLDKLIEGNIVKLRITLPEEYAMMYHTPADSVYTVAENNNNIFIVLQPFKEVTVSGVAKDEETGLPMRRANVVIVQTLNDKHTKIWNTQTDDEGRFSLTVFDVAGELSIQSDGYVKQNIECGNWLSADFSNVQMKPASGVTVTTYIQYTASVVDGDTTDVQNKYPDYANIVYTIYNSTQGKDIKEYSVQYPHIILMENVAAGDVLKITATSRTGAFAPISTETTVDAQNRASVLIDIVQPGCLRATFKKNNNSRVAGILYNVNGERVTAANYSNAVLTLNELPDGTYTLVTMGESSLFNSVYNLSQLDALEIVEGRDFIKNSVTIEKGRISIVENDEIPYLDESKLYYTGDNTEFYVNKTDVSVGNYITFTGKINFKSEYSNSISNVSMVVDLPESAEFIENSVIIGNNLANCSMNKNRLIIPLENNTTDRVRFCIIPKSGGNYMPNAFVQFDIDGKQIMQPIGNATYSAKELDINVPSVITNTSFPVSGTAIGVSEVFIYADDMLIGKTTSLSNGVWIANCKMGNIYNMSKHNVYAKIITSQGVELQSEIKECTYDKYGVEVNNVTLHCNNAKVVFDFKNPSLIEKSYTCNGNSSFTFTIDFTQNDTARIADVELFVKTMAGKWFGFPAKYDSVKNQWVVRVWQSVLGESYPVNVNVDYHCKKKVVADREQFDKNVEDVYYNLALSDDEYARLKSYLSFDNEDSLSNAVFEELDEILAADSVDYDALFEKLNEIIPDTFNTVPDNIVVDYDSLVASFEEMKKEFNAHRRDSLLAELYMFSSGNLNIADDINETVTSESGQCLYKKTKLSVIDEKDLLEKGYTVLNVTDTTKIYSLFTGSKIEYIDSKTREKYSVEMEMFKSTKAYLRSTDLSKVECIESLSRYIADLKSFEYPSSSSLEDILQYELNVAKIASDLLGSIECIYSSLRIEAENKINKTYLEESNAIKEKIEKRKNLEDVEKYKIQLCRKEQERILKNRKLKIEELENVTKQLNEGNVTGEALEKLLNEQKVLKVEIDAYSQALDIQELEIKRVIDRMKILWSQNYDFENQLKNLVKLRDLALKNLAKVPASLINGVPSSKFISTLGKLAGPFGVFIELACLYDDVSKFNEDAKEWGFLIQAMINMLPCEKDSQNAMNLKNRISEDFSKASAWWKSIIVSEGLAVVVDVATPPNVITWAVSGGFSAYAEWTKLLAVEKYVEERGNHWMAMCDLECYEKDDESNNNPYDPDKDPNNPNNDDRNNGENDNPRGYSSGSTDIKPIIDPAGYVYEGVPSNRLEGVTATCYYKETVEDMYGDKHENIVLWDAEKYGQQNPLVTDKNGMYRWDVPQGLWQVKFEKEGYETAYSEWLPVPPPQLEVNIAMTQYRQPEVKDAVAYENAIEVEFDKYMKAESLNVDNFVVTQNGQPVNGAIELLNVENSSDSGGERLATIVRFNVAEPFTAQEVALVVKKEVTSYAGLTMAEDYSCKLKVEKEIKQMVVDDEVYVPYMGEKSIYVTILPVQASAGKIVNAKVESNALATLTAANAIIDKQGKAQFTIKGELPGATTLHFSIEGTRTAAQTIVKIVEQEDFVIETPQASVASGSHVYKGSKVMLSTNDKKLKIWYTTDGSCPCDENGTRKLYSQPIVISKETTLAAMAENEEGETSDTETFVYEILKSDAGVELHEGWNWVSLNMESDALSSVNAALKSGTWSSEDEIKNAYYFDSYSKNNMQWMGTLSQHGGLKNSEMYKVHSSREQNIRLTGDAINPEKVIIAVGSGWNYISYLPLTDLSVEEALSGYKARVGDIIKSQNAFAVYTDKNRWEGDLTTLSVGRGYMLKRAADAAATSFYYPAAAKIKNNSARISRRGYYNYADNMNLIGVVDDYVASEGDSLVAVVQGEERGTCALQNDAKVYLTIQGDNAANVELVLKRQDKIAAKANNKITFKSNAVVGTIESPIKIKFAATSEADRISVTPRIVENELSVAVNDENMRKVEIYIYSTDGSIVRESKENVVLNGYYTETFMLSDISAGVYIVKIVINNELNVVRIIKK